MSVGLSEDELPARSDFLGGFDHPLPALRSEATIDNQRSFFAHHNSNVRDKEDPAVRDDPNILSYFAWEASVN
jgi:hypothetical protein